MWRRGIGLTAAAVATLLVGAAPAAGHGPCRCLDPMLVEPGREVRLTNDQGRQAGGVGQPAYRVVLNPRPSDFGIAPDYLAGAYRPDAPTTTVLSRNRRDPTRTGRFRVPAGTPGGLYMVLIFDGDEGGAHNTWGYLHVAGRGSEPQPTGEIQTAETDDPTPWGLIAGIGLAGLLLGAAGGRATRRR